MVTLAERISICPGSGSTRSMCCAPPSGLPRRRPPEFEDEGRGCPEQVTPDRQLTELPVGCDLLSLFSVHLGSVLKSLADGVRARMNRDRPQDLFANSGELVGH